MEIAHALLPRRVLTKSICSSCLRQLRRQRSLHTPSRLRQDDKPRPRSYIAAAGEQAFPPTGYYAELLHSPLHVQAAWTRPSGMKSVPEATKETGAASVPPKEVVATKRAPRDSSDKEEIMAKAKMVFGSRLAGPIQRRKEIAEKSTVVAGVVVPPRPGEPDNCCMSGCVNCVWDQYRDELEEWAAQTKLAREALAKQQQSSSKKRGRPKKADKESLGIGTGSMVVPPGTPSHVATSMDDDGGGSDTNWGSGSTDDLFGGIPVGIREFMKTEKMLKNRHAAERASAS